MMKDEGRMTKREGRMTDISRLTFHASRFRLRLGLAIPCLLPTATCLPPPASRLLLHRQRHSERCSLASNAFHCNRTAVRLDNQFAQCQAQAQAARFGCEEWLEQFVANFWWNAGASIGDANFDGGWLTADG